MANSSALAGRYCVVPSLGQSTLYFPMFSATAAAQLTPKSA